MSEAFYHRLADALEREESPMVTVVRRDPEGWRCHGRKYPQPTGHLYPQDKPDVCSVCGAPRKT